MCLDINNLPFPVEDIVNEMCDWQIRSSDISNWLDSLSDEDRDLLYINVVKPLLDKYTPKEVATKPLISYS